MLGDPRIEEDLHRRRVRLIGLAAWNDDGDHPDRDTELHFILSRFDRFEGELVILSEILDGHWRAHDKASPERTAESGL